MQTRKLKTMVGAKAVFDSPKCLRKPLCRCGLIFLVCLLMAVQTVSAKESEWTFLLYLAADNNLEAATLGDLREMIAVTDSDEVQIVALVDRSEKHDPSIGYSKEGVGQLPDWTTGKLLKIQHKELVELADWGEVNMGDPATLKRFLETAMKSFPARKYALVFGDHGAGWPGVCGDESHDHAMLSMNQIHHSLSSLPKAASRFELIGFDACLMGNLECAYSIAPFGKVMVASEELEPGFGWHYTPLLQSVIDRPTMSGKEVGKIIVESFDEFYRKSSHEQIQRLSAGTTLSAIDLSKLDAVLKGLQTLAEACQSDLTENGRASWLSLSDARARSEEFGKKDEHGNGMGLIDLGHLIKLIRTQFTEGPIDVAAQALEKSLKSAVIANRHGKGRAHAHGLSIFFPADYLQLTGREWEDDSTELGARNAKNVDPNPRAYSNTLFAKSNPWMQFVKEFTVVAESDTEDPVLGEIVASSTTITPGQSATFTVDVTADDIETISFVLAKRQGDVQVVIGSLPSKRDDEGNLSDEWDGKWFTLKAGSKQLICPVTEAEPVEPEEGDESAEPKDEDAKGTQYYLEVPAQIQRQDKVDWFEVSLYFYVDLSDDDLSGEFVYAFRDTENGPAEVPLNAGDRIRPVFLVIADDGKETQVTSDDENLTLDLEDPDDLTVGMSAVAPGNYEVGFHVYDYSENYSEQFVEVTVTK